MQSKWGWFFTKPQPKKEKSQHWKPDKWFAPENYKSEKQFILSCHSRIRVQYGKADKCEGTNCSGISNKYDYALIKGRKYSINRDDYIMLCRSCHNKYDNIAKKGVITKGFNFNE